MKVKVLAMVLVVSGLGWVVATVFYPTWRANRIRNAVVAFDWAHADAEAARKLSEQLGGSSSCVSGACQFDVVARNRILSGLHLAPPTYFNLSIHTDGNAVQDCIISMGENGKEGDGRWSTVWVIRKFVEEAGANREPYEVMTSSAHKGRGVYVKMSPFSTAQQQSAMLANLHTDCLSRIRGCSEQQLSPAIWGLGSFSQRVE